MVKLGLAGNFTHARTIHGKLIDFINTLFAEGNPGGIKAALNILGLIGNNLRLPLAPVSEYTYDKLARQLEEIKK